MTHHKSHKPETTDPQAQAADNSGTPAEGQPDLALELEQARASAAESLDGWRRAQAELANFRKRMERDAADMRIQAVGRVAANWFPVLDDLLRALNNRPAPENFPAWADGMDLIYRKGQTALELEGITPIRPAPGEVFDPNRHEAVTMEPCPDRKDGEIIETVRCGYSMGERVLRPAQVRVACER